MPTVRDTQKLFWLLSRGCARGLWVLEVCCLALLILPVGLMQAQPEPLNEAWRWARFGAASGLPSDRGLDVVETSNGVSWARTEARLAWYDTYQWHPVTIVEDSTPQWPSRIVPDRQGGILAVANRRLYRVDQEGVSAIAIEEEAGRLAVRDVIPLDDEALLVLTLGGLYRHHPGGLDPFPAPEEVTPEEIAGSLFFTEVEGVWISTARGLFQWTGEGWVKRFDHATRLLRVGPWGGLAAVIDGPHRSTACGPGRPARRQDTLRVRGMDRGLSHRCMSIRWATPSSPRLQARYGCVVTAGGPC